MSSANCDPENRSDSSEGSDEDTLLPQQYAPWDYSLKPIANNNVYCNLIAAPDLYAIKKPSDCNIYNVIIKAIQFCPENITIKQSGRTLTFECKQAERCVDGCWMSSVVVRRIVIPDMVNMKLLETRISNDYTLSVLGVIMPRARGGAPITMSVRPARQPPQNPRNVVREPQRYDLQTSRRLMEAAYRSMNAPGYSYWSMYPDNYVDMLSHLQMQYGCYKPTQQGRRQGPRQGQRLGPSQAHTRGSAQGRSSGHPQDYSQAYPQGQPQDLSQGYSQGRSLAYPQDYSEGYPQDDSQDHPEDNSQGYPQDDSQDYPQDYTQGYSQDNSQDYSQGYSRGYPREYSQSQPQGYPQEYSQGYPQSYSQGYSQSYAQGHPKGYPQGRSQGYPQGNSQGYPQGRAQGYQQGYSQGYLQGNSQGYSQDDSQDYPQDDSQGYPQDQSQGYPQGQSQGYPQGQSQGYPQDQSQGYLQDQSQGYPQGQSQGYPQGRSQVRPSSQQRGPISNGNSPVMRSGHNMDTPRDNSPEESYEILSAPQSEDDDIETDCCSKNFSSD